MRRLLVHCRTGSSEIDADIIKLIETVHCRTGSSENCHW